MGEKGAKLSDESSTAVEVLLKKLSQIQGVTSKKMFGGYGIFCNEKMFCIVDSKGQSFLKVDDDLKSKLTELGGQQHSRMPYYSIPDSILNNTEKLSDLAKASIKTAK